MKTPEEFVSEFLSEVAALHKKYTDFPASEEQIESASKSDSSVLVVTRFASQRGKLRYRLRRAGESWMITGKEYSCFRCETRGTEDACRMCKGAGWIPLVK